VALSKLPGRMQLAIGKRMVRSHPPLETRMKIAIIGSGIAGLTCAYLLNRRHDITLFEASDWIGGHTHTVDVTVDGRECRGHRLHRVQ
jgi:predicted NAD/FAD-binding protein